MKIAVIGAGLMGTQIGVEYALGGHEVTYVVRDEARAATRIETTLALVGDLALVSEAAIASVPDRLTTVLSVDALSQDTGVVIESIAEDLDAKGVVLRQAAAHLPAATLASNTSSISITLLGDAAGAADRVLGCHYWNPPLLMPLVEIIAAPETDPARVTAMVELVTGLGKRPVVAERDVPGFIWNRMQLALLREAVWLVENGVASPAAIDQVVREGLARRWRYTGPFATAALGGAATFERIANNLWPVISDADHLDGLESWLETDPATLSATRERRDRGLRDDLTRDSAGDE